MTVPLDFVRIRAQFVAPAAEEMAARATKHAYLAVGAGALSLLAGASILLQDSQHKISHSSSSPMHYIGMYAMWPIFAIAAFSFARLRFALAARANRARDRSQLDTGATWFVRGLELGAMNPSGVEPETFTISAEIRQRLLQSGRLT